MKDAKIDYFRIKEQNATAEAWLVEYTDKNVLYIPLRRWTKGYTIKQPNMDCQPTEITALMR